MPVPVRADANSNTTPIAHRQRHDEPLPLQCTHASPLQQGECRLR